MTEEKDKASSIVITYQDGHTESYDTFIALVALGLTPVGREGSNILYMAEEGKLQTHAIVHIAATAEVIAALVNSFTELVGTLLSHSNPEEALDLMAAILSLSSRQTEEHTEVRTKRIYPEKN